MFFGQYSIPTSVFDLIYALIKLILHGSFTQKCQSNVWHYVLEKMSKTCFKLFPTVSKLHVLISKSKHFFINNACRAAPFVQSYSKASWGIFL